MKAHLSELSSRLGFWMEKKKATQFMIGMSITLGRPDKMRDQKRLDGSLYASTTAATGQEI